MKIKKKLLALVMAAVTALSVVACSSSNGGGDTNKPIYIGQPSILSAVEPTESSNGWSLIGHGIAEGVYKVDEEGNLVSRFIKELNQVDENNWEATLNEDVMFSDGEKVDAKALAKCMNEITEKNPISQGTVGAIKFEATGDYSVKINTEKVTKTLSSVLSEWTHVVYKEDKDGNYIFTGPYTVKNLDAGIQLDLQPNEYYPNAEKRSDVIVKAFEDTSAMKLAFESGEIDMAFNLPVDVSKMLESEKHIVNKFDAGYQYFSFVNLENKTLSDLKVRQALNKLFDREEMLKALNGGQVAKGMFANYFSFAGNSDVKTDVEEAKKLLDEAGWKLNSDGIREKDGKTLELNLVTYASRPDLPIIMQIMASQLDSVGIKTKTSMSDDISKTAADGDYDLMVYAQFTAPYGEPAFFLNQTFRSSAETNYARYNSKEFDEILDEISNLPLGKERDELAIKAQELLFEDLPVLYLVDPQWKIAVSERLENYKIYGGDYYVINDKLGIE